MHYHRSTRDEHIQQFEERYPRTFSAKGSMRRPLKNGIVNDLIDEGVDKDTAVQILGWYTQDFDYQRALLVGAERIDLNGKAVGKVTLAEQQTARRYITQRKEEMIREQQLRITPAVAAKPNGHMNGATVRLAAVPATNPRAAPMKHAPTPPPPSNYQEPPPVPVVLETLARITTAVAVVRVILNQPQYKSLHLPFVETALSDIDHAVNGAVAILVELP